MRTIVVATVKPFAPAALKKMKKIFQRAGEGYRFVLLEKYQGEAALLQAVADADALIVRSDKVNDKVLNAAKKLKIVVRAGAGYDNIDVETATQNGVVVMNTPGQNSNAVAELAVGLAIFGLREKFSGKAGGELRGRTLGLHGFGYVARNVFRIARAFGMKVVVYTRYSKGAAAAIGLKVTKSLEQLYAKSDIVSVHVPARGEHIQSVCYEVLKHVKDGAVVVNTSRKEVVNEADLLRIMEEKPQLKYMSDIQPDKAAVFMEKFSDRCFFTSKKAGAQTIEANVNTGGAAMEQVIAFFEKGDTTYQVN